MFQSSWVVASVMGAMIGGWCEKGDLTKVETRRKKREALFLARRLGEGLGSPGEI